jgi:putative methionine-R-sulfoxide reductase with GAF domain
VGNPIYLQRPVPSLSTIPSNFSNTASLLWHAYHSLPGPSSAVNWAGFYFVDPTHPSRLILGPFQGQVACQVIAFGKGVCGAAAQTKTTQLVRDVEKFPGHIACDGASKSEIVVPIVQDGKVCARYICERSIVDCVANRSRSSPSSTLIVQSWTDSAQRTRQLWKSWRSCWQRVAPSRKHENIPTFHP